MQAFSFGETACIYLFLVFIGLTLERTHLLEKICVELGCVHSLPLPPMPPHVLMNFRGFPPGWCEWWYAGRWNTRRGLKPKSANYPDHGHHGNLSLKGKIPMVEPGIEPATSWLVVRDPDHSTTRRALLICKVVVYSKICYGAHTHSRRLSPRRMLHLPYNYIRTGVAVSNSSCCSTTCKSVGGIWNGVTCFIVSIADVPRFCIVSTISCFI